MTAVVVAVAGGLGALCRAGLERLAVARFGHAFPWGTLAVNVSGALGLGLVVGWVATTGTLRTALGVGALGGYTTFSTFAVETLRLLERRQSARAIVYGVASTAAALAAAALGLALSGGFDHLG